ncbi:Anucleate primary sterigmata protein A [Cyphellophora attinorum]|uniref:Anucleate primary sterigmata protein A n=1 Tax=Cyphellophora attinorum TaxID=1664694 RepID=A0A0N0NRN3_9EURO|nr:Anucleate primary sterigmata protein A [Phialophora attinorum]KPI45288.1 Anucleate primary sterigmata protein A [Phialophora attinorum]
MEVETAFNLPSPTDTPYRTPSSTRSNFDDMSPATTPPPMGEDRASKRRSTDSINPALDDTISPLDPRRFTPTLHASLVSEILSLRRDLESRSKDIERLEQSLHQSQQQNDALNTNLLNSNKQTREVKRQMQMLEGGTLSAISDLGHERDKALEEVAELKRRLEQSQKRAKSHEDTAERTQALWNSDKDSWMGEKRAMETKVQIAEGRLKVIMSEIANVHASDRLHSPERTRSRSDSRNSVRESPSKKRESRLGRRASASSVHSDHIGGRVSALSFVNGTGLNLADELAFDEEEEDHLAEDYANGRVSPDALPEEQHDPRPSSSLSIKARKILGLPLEFGEQDKENSDPEARPTSSYVDTAVQFSPPPSPWPRTESQMSQAMTQSMKRSSKPTDLHLVNGRLSGSSARSPTSPTDSRDSRYDSTYAPWNHTGPIMVSSGVQTVEALPSPPLTPEKSDVLSIIHESAAENVEMKTSATQTEHSGAITPPLPERSPKPRSWQHLSTESGELHIPLINIVPPTSRPTTPTATGNVVLPPRTRNAGSQVAPSDLGSYVSTPMQTEEIRVDRRNIIPLAQMPSLPTSTAPPANAFKAPVSTRVVPPRRKTAAPIITVAQRTVGMNVGMSRMPPSNDSGPLSREAVQGDTAGPNLPRPVRSSSLYQGYQDENVEETDKFEEQAFEDDDIFSRPTGKFTLRSGKMVPQDILEDIGEVRATEAGAAAALENLRLSEDSLSSDITKQINRDIVQRGNSGSLKSLKRIPSARSNNMRRAALISSGSAAHRASTSQSTNASADSGNPPPFPVPLRYSSARITRSEGGRSSRASSNTSPTRTSRLKRQVLRKSRSGPAISPYGEGRRSRSRSPPLASRVSIVPEMPTFQMPEQTPSFLNAPYAPPALQEASAPRPSIATGPRRDRSGTHVKQNSDAGLLNQTSVVDSIAQTMIGEWMYKYVRRRKSFGMGEKQDNWETGKSVDEISANVTTNGVRHKRWVWLAPYERAVMWSSKQPTSGSALMGGKSGRKLIIKSVLDVKDDNSMPKGSISGPHFNRSILILTPQRALKFTALTQDRHFVWLTALSFLSHSPLGMNDLDAMPPPPEDNTAQMPPPPASLAGSFRRRPIRDSIRIAKGTRPQQSIRSFTTDNSYPHLQEQYEGENEYYDPMNDPALPPTIKRFHTRKRSNTAPRAPPSSFRGAFSQYVPNMPGPGSSHYATSTAVTSATGSDRGLYTPSLGIPSLASSRRGSESSTAGRPHPHQFLYQDAGNNNNMVRIDAFVDNARHANNHNRPPLVSNGSSGNAAIYNNGPISRGNNGLGGVGGPPQLKKPVFPSSSSWGIDEERHSYSPVDSLMYHEMQLAVEAPPSVPASARGSEDNRADWFRGF